MDKITFLSEKGKSKYFLLALCLIADGGGWFLLYSRFIASFYYSNNFFLWPLLLLQSIPAWLAAGMTFRHRSRLELSWSLLALMLFLWPVADILEQLSIGDSQGIFLVAGHATHVVAYCAAFLAIFLMAPFTRPPFGRLRYQVDLLIHAASWGLLLWVLLGAPLLQAVPAAGMEMIWPILYAGLDLIILMLLLWFQGQAWMPDRSVWLITAGFFLFSVFDLATGWISLQTGSVSYIWLGFISIAGSGCMAWAMLLPEKIGAGFPVENNNGNISSSLRHRWQRVEERWLPIASAIALVTLVLAQWNRTGSIDPALAGCTVALCLLLFLREGVIAGQAELAGYRVLLENLADPACICLSDGRVLLENPALSVWSGDAHAERNIARALPMDPPWSEVLPQAIRNGWEGEVILRLSSRDGQPAWLVIRPLPAEPGGQLRIACLLHDLSPQRRQENALREAIQRVEDAQHGLQQFSERLEERVREQTADLSSAMAKLEAQNRQLLTLDRMKSDFVALTSHELRTPLAGIRAGLEWALLRKPPLPKDARANLTLAHREVERLGRFVEDVLDLSALEAGKLPMQIGPLAVSSAWEQARSALCASRSGRGSSDMDRLAADIPDNLPEIMADEHVLASVLFQLVDNAFKYALQGKVMVTAGSAGDAMVEIFVQDEGPGVSPDERDRLFVSFSRLDSMDSPHTPGIGLGLYLSRRMIEAMGGRLESPPTEKGLAMRLLLPVYSEPG